MPAFALGGPPLLTASDDTQSTGTVTITLLSLLVGSVVVVEIVASSSMTVPRGVEDGVVTVRKCTTDPGASVGVEQFTGPVPPAAGVVQLQPPGAIIETNDVLLGVLNDTTTFDASSGPSLLAEIENCAFDPAIAGEPEVTEASMETLAV